MTTENTGGVGLGTVRKGTALGGAVYVELPEMAISFARGLILQMWVRPDVLQDAELFTLAGTIRLVARKDGDVEFWWGSNCASGRFRLMVGVWNHLTVVLDPAGVALYLDGALTNVASTWNMPVEAARAGNAIGVASGQTSGAFSGAIADVRLWNRSSGLAVILDRRLRDLRGDEPGLVGRWTLEGATGVRDTSSFGRDGALRGGAFKAGASSFTISPPLARCLDLKGEGVVLVDTTLTVSRSFTWQAQVLVRDLARESELVRVNGLLISTVSGIVNVTASNRQYRSAALLKANTWASLALRIGDDGKVALFVAGAPVSLTDVGVAQTVIGAAIRLGEKLDGQMAEVRLWTRALTSAEIADTSARRIHGWAPGLLGCWRLDEEIEDTSSLRATAYADADFKGQSQSLGVGRYDWNALTVGNNTLSSLRVPYGLRVTLYEQGGFAGASEVYTADVSLVAKNDVTSSIVVEERHPPQATIYPDGNYAGQGQSLSVGRYDWSALTIGNDKLSSLRVPAGLRVTLYEHGGFTGARWVYYADQAQVGNNDATSSIVVERCRELVNADPSGPVARSFGALPAASTLVLAGAPRVAPPRVAGLGGALELPTVEAIGGGGFTAQMWVNLDPLAGEATLFQLDGFATLYPDPNFVGTPQVLRRGSHDVGALSVGNDKLSSIRVSSGTRATLYKESGFKGDSYGVDEDLATLTWMDNLASSIKVEGAPAVEVRARSDGDALGLTVKITGAGNDQTSSIRVEESGPPQVTIYTDADFNGACQDLGVGRYDIGALTIGNDKLSSLRVPPGLKVTLYDDVGFKGASVVYTRDTRLVTNNERTSSIVVEESAPLYATIYADSNFTGTSQKLGIGRYDAAELTIGNDNLSSLRVPAGLKVTIYEHGGFSGRAWAWTCDGTLASSNNLMSSIVVERDDPRRVTIYADADFTGVSQYLAIGSYDVGALGIGNDQLSSLKVPEGLKVTLFENAGFAGKSRVFTADTALVGTEELVIERAFTARRWTHLTITQDADGILCVYVGGRLIRREERTPLPPQALIPRIGPFNGSVTEVRLWPRALTPEEVEATWQRRAAGAPAARWALHGDLKGSAGDASGAVTWREAPSLAVKDPGAPALPTVRGRASLMADPTGKGGKPQLCVDFTATDASGRPVPGVELTVESGAAVEAYRKCVDALHQNRITDTARFTLKADMRGKARVVLMPESLQLPVLKVRHAGMGEGEWAIVTPDQIIFDTLASLTTSELRGGRRAGTTTAAGTAGLITSGEEHLVELLRGMFSAAASSFSFEAESTAALAFGDLEDEASAPVSVVGGNLVQVAEGTALVRRLVPVGTAFVVAADDEMATSFAVGDRFRKVWNATVTFVTNVAQDVLETVEGVARAVAAPVIEAITIAVDAVVNGIAIAKEWVIKTVEDIVTIAVDIFKKIGKAVGDVLGYLAAVFDWGDILATADMMLGEVQRAIAKSKTGVSQIFDKLKTSIRIVESKVLELLGGSGAAALPAPTRPEEASPDAVLPEPPSLLDLLLSLLPDDLAQTIRDIEAVFDPIKDVLNSALGRLPALGDGLAAKWNAPELQAAFKDPKRFLDGDPAEWKALARLVVSFIANCTETLVDFLGDLVVAVFESFQRLVNLRLNIPVLTPWVEEHVLQGAQLTVGRMCCLVMAIPLTATYKVLTGSKSGPAELMDGPLNFADKKPMFIRTATSRSVDLLASTYGGIVDSYESLTTKDASKGFKWVKVVLDAVNLGFTVAGVIVDLADDEDWGGWEWCKFVLDSVAAGAGLVGCVGSVVALVSKVEGTKDAADFVDAVCGIVGDGCGIVSGIIDISLTAIDDETSKREVAVSSLDFAATVGSLAANIAGVFPKEAAKDGITTTVRTVTIAAGNVVGVACKSAALGVYIRDYAKSLSTTRSLS